MKLNSETYYTTGQFAKLCKVNKRTLFHYDDIGLFHPAFTDENGYRYYTYHQLDVFSIITILKELDVPLKEIKAYLDERTPTRILELSNNKIAEVNKAMDKLSQIKHILEETVIYTNKGLQSKEDNITLEEQDEELILRSQAFDSDNRTDSFEWMMNFRNFEDSTVSLRTSFVGAMVSSDLLLTDQYNIKSYLYVKINDPHQAEFSNDIKPKGLYAVAYHHGSYETIESTYKKLTQYIQDNNLNIGTFAYEQYLIDEVGAKDDSNYVTSIAIAVDNCRIQNSKMTHDEY